MSETYKVFTHHEPSAELVRQKLLEFGFSNAFLMSEILAVAAFHLSIIEPDRKKFYQYQADVLQSHALASYRQVNLATSEATCKSSSHTTSQFRYAACSSCEARVVMLYPSP
jgi:hypothetical protein